MSERQRYFDSTKCRSCEAEIRFIKTRTGALMPTNVPPQEEEISREAVMTAEEFNPDYMVSHFSTCPKAAAHSKKSKEKKA